MTWFDSAKTLAEFASLADDWDGEGAIAPKPLLILKAMLLLIELHDAGDRSPPSRVGACPMGGILFEWQQACSTYLCRGGSHSYLEVEITPAGAIEWMEERKGKTRHGVGTPDGRIEWKENQ